MQRMLRTKMFHIINIASPFEVELNSTSDQTREGNMSQHDINISKMNPYIKTQLSVISISAPLCWAEK